MATYSKETALYDTGAIADDIAGAGNTANYYLTTISGTSGISVHNKNDTSNYVNINSTDGMNVVKGGTNVAQFGTTARVGSASSSHFNMNASSLQAYDSNNNKYFEVSPSGITYGSNTVANTTDVSDAVNAVEVYSLDSSYPSVTVDTNGSHPASLTLSSTYTKGSAAPASYAGRIKVETSLNNSTWTTEYTSSSDESSVTYNSPANITDNAPYNFRAVPSGVGNVMRDDSIVGGTVAWNQMITNSTYTNSVTDTRGFLSLRYVATVGGSTDFSLLPTVTSPSVVDFIHAPQYTKTVVLKHNGAVSDLNMATGIPFVSGHKYYTHLKVLGADPTTVGGVSTSEQMCIDLTQMFGSTIADYIYSLEQANVGAGVAWFKKLFPKPYYAYNAGELKSVSGLVSHDMTGFNQWDEEWESGYYVNGVKTANSQYIRNKNYIPCLPNTTYYFKRGGTPTNNYRYLFYYDADKNYITSYSNGYINQTFTTPENAYYMNFSVNGTSYSNDICINISWDGSRDGEYEPYELHSYPLDSDVVLRGILKLDTNNKLYYDGDEYLSDGTVNRKYGVVDLGTLTWNYEASPTGSFYADVAVNGRTPENPPFTPWTIMPKYDFYFGVPSDMTQKDKVYCMGNRKMSSNNKRVFIRDTTYNGDTTAFKTAMNGVYLVYELATPTTETADTFQSTQAVNSFGTEEYVTTGIPVGHNRTYISGVKAIRASLYKAGGTTTLLAQKIIPCGTDLGSQAIDAAQTATTYITAIDDDGIKVHASNNPNSNYTKIDADGMEVYKGGSNVASFGTETIIRTSDGTQLAYFGYGDTAGSEGASATAPFYSFGKTVPPVTPFPSWISGSNYKRGDIIVYNQLAYISTSNQNNDTIIPPNNDSWVRIFIHPSTDKGGYSFVTGYGTRALSYASHAEGGNSTNGQGVYNTYTTAAGYSSHAEGEDVIAIGARSHAEGYSTTTVGGVSHAEGHGCYAGGEVSHAEGYFTNANGDYSHAQNYITKANYDYQTVIGQWNSNQSDTAFEIGNGTDVTHLSNAFTVDWKGNVRMYLDSNGTSSADATSGSDKELFNAIRALGWYSDVIV